MGIFNRKMKQQRENCFIVQDLFLSFPDKESKLKFHGLCFSKDSESLPKDTTSNGMRMAKYIYDSTVSDVILLCQQDQSNYFLTVDDTDIKFKTEVKGDSGTVLTETVNKC